MRPDKPWALRLSIGGGYNSNVQAVSEHTPLSLDAVGKDAAAFKLVLAGRYDMRRTSTSTLSAGYSLRMDAYEERAGDFDLIDHYVFVGGRQWFNSRLYATAILSEQYTTIGGGGYRNQVSARPALGYRFADWATVEMSYQYSISDYLFSVPSFLDLDAHTHTIAVSQYVTVPDTTVNARVGYFHTWNDAEGLGFDYETDGFFIGLASKLPWEINGSVFYTFSISDYDDPNFFAGGPGRFAFAREDHRDTLSLRLSRPMSEQLDVYVQYDYINQASNTDFFDYDQEVFSAGVVIEF